jgi:hypothetical protein
MSLLEQFVDELEAKEAAENLFFSIYYIPPEFQPEGHPYDH